MRDTTGRKKFFLSFFVAVFILVSGIPCSADYSATGTVSGPYPYTHTVKCIPGDSFTVSVKSEHPTSVDVLFMTPSGNEWAFNSVTGSDKRTSHELRHTAPAGKPENNAEYHHYKISILASTDRQTRFSHIMERKILTAYGIRMFKDTGADITVRSDSGDNVLASILFNNNAWDFFNRRISAINTLFDLGFSIQDMYPNWTIENFSKRILNSSMEKTAKESMALFFAMKLGPEKSAELLKIIEQNRVGAVEMIASLPSDTKGIKGLEEKLLKTLVQTKGRKFLLDSNNKSIQERFVSTLLAVMETNPGLVIEFIKKCLSPKQFALWSNIKCDGAEKLTAKIVPLIKKNNNKKTSEEESPDIFF